MPSIVRQTASPAHLAAASILVALERIISRELVQAVVAAHAPATRRRRLLPAELTLVLVIAMNLYAKDALTLVLAKLLLVPRLFPSDGTLVPASKGGISQARARLGIRPVADLFHRVCQPLATAACPWAFLAGLRLMALDGSAELVADTPANERVFGRHASQYGPAAFPQVLAVYLLECGTHAIIDACFGPGHASPNAAATRLLRRVEQGMLVLVDQGLYSADLVWSIVARQAHVLARLPSNVILEPVQGVADGSYLARLYAVAPSRRRVDEASVLVRVLVYTLTDPDRPGYATTHRLITSLLDPVACPARELICAYHERWEIELTIDEIQSHQRPVGRPLRSKTPQGVIQELYGLLLAHYVVRAVMYEAALQAGLDPDRISFVHALGLIITMIPLMQALDEPLRAALYYLVLDDLVRLHLPPRELRTNPRVVKRKSSKFRHKAPGQRGTSLRVPFLHTVAVSSLGAALLPQATGQPSAA